MSVMLAQVGQRGNPAAHVLRPLACRPRRRGAQEGQLMRILMVGAGGVGSAATVIAKRRDFFDLWVVADYDLAKAEATVAKVADPRFVAARVDASSTEAVTALALEHGATHVFNAVDPVFNMPIFDGAFAAGADYLDMAMSLSQKHPEQPYALTGVKL